MATVRDEEAQELVRESLRLIVQAERTLTQLEDHVQMLQAFIHAKTGGNNTTGVGG